MTKKAIKLTKPQRRALEGIEVLRQSNGTEMATLRANGNRRDVVDRLCALGLAFAAGSYADPDLIRFALTPAGAEVLAEGEDQ